METSTLPTSGTRRSSVPSTRRRSCCWRSSPVRSTTHTATRVPSSAERSMPSSHARDRPRAGQGNRPGVILGLVSKRGRALVGAARACDRARARRRAAHRRRDTANLRGSSPTRGPRRSISGRRSDLGVGWSQARFERGIDQQVTAHVRGVSHRVLRAHRRSSLDRLVIACAGELRPVIEHSLDSVLKGVLVGIIERDLKHASADQIAGIVARPLSSMPSGSANASSWPGSRRGSGPRVQRPPAWTRCSQRSSSSAWQSCSYPSVNPSVQDSARPAGGYRPTVAAPGPSTPRPSRPSTQWSRCSFTLISCSCSRSWLSRRRQSLA